MTLNHLNILSDNWGEAVSSRPIQIVGFSKPWTVTIATVNDKKVLAENFGHDYQRTTILQFDLEVTARST